MGENAERRWAEREMCPIAHRQPDPPCGKGGAELAVREQRDIARKSREAGDKPIRAFADLRGRLAARTAIPKHVPIRAPLENVGRKLAFVIAVVPLGQVGIDLRRAPQTGKFAGTPRALARAGQDVGKSNVANPLAEFARLGLAVLVQRNVGTAGMLAGKRPRGFAVANEPKPLALWWLRGHALSSTVLYSPRRAARLQRAR